VYSENSDSLYRAYLDATSIPNGYIIMDFAQDTDYRVSFGSNVFPDECTPVIFAPVNDETRKVELS